MKSFKHGYLYYLHLYMSSERDKAQFRTHPSWFHMVQHVQVSSGLNHYCLSYRVHRQTHRHTDTHQDRQTDTKTPRQTDRHQHTPIHTDVHE